MGEDANRDESETEEDDVETSVDAASAGSAPASAGGLTECQWALFAHLASFGGYLLPLGNILGPLVIWLMKKDESPFVARHGAQALNFQISITIYFLVCFVLTVVFVGILGMIAVIVIDLVYTILNMVRASEGREPRYPLTLRFVR